MKTSIISYGAGNVLSVANAFEAIGEDIYLASTPEDIANADRLVLPGVGAAGAVMEALHQKEIDEALTESVRARGRPLLGICVGMQILSDRLHEFGETQGLSWSAGEVREISELGAPRAPHMGWNNVTCGPGSHTFERQLDGKYFYFCHSFAVTGAPDAHIAGTTDYGGSLTAALHFDTVLATQFHPEKSQLDGQRLLESFVDWTP